MTTRHDEIIKVILQETKEKAKARLCELIVQLHKFPSARVHDYSERALSWVRLGRHNLYTVYMPGIEVGRISDGSCLLYPDGEIYVHKHGSACDNYGRTYPIPYGEEISIMDYLVFSPRAASELLDIIAEQRPRPQETGGTTCMRQSEYLANEQEKRNG